MVKSWYPKIKIHAREKKYLRMIQSMFRVQDATRRWIPYKLTPHQIEWHRDDVACQLYNAKNRVCFKSRNTSFTTSSIISSLMDVGVHQNPIVPFVRLNQRRANDLISEIKDTIRHMDTVVKTDDGRYFPFNPDLVEMDNAQSIYFPDRDVEFRAFPATGDAAEVIRGLRIVGSAGIIDECNFMRYFTDIYIAARDTTSGVDEHGRSAFQLNMGTTLKGNATDFKLWLDDKLKKRPRNISFYHWPVFDPTQFDKEKPPNEQQHLVPIVPWQSVEKLTEVYEDDVSQFLEEYMCVTVDSEDQLYAQKLILDVSDNDFNYAISVDRIKALVKWFKNRHGHRPETRRHFTEIVKYYEENDGITPPPGMYTAGVDVGYTNDFFVYSLFAITENACFDQQVLHYVQGINPDIAFALCGFYTVMFNPARLRVDAQGQGFSIGVELRNAFGNHVEAIRTSTIKGVTPKDRIPFKEYIHTNQHALFSARKVTLINDEMQHVHYGLWDKKYNAPSTKRYGHGDIVIANGNALLPQGWKQPKGRRTVTSVSTDKVTGERTVRSTGSHDDHDDESEVSEEVDWTKMSIKDRMAYYRKHRG